MLVCGIFKVKLLKRHVKQKINRQSENLIRLQTDFKNIFLFCFKIKFIPQILDFQTIKNYLCLWTSDMRRKKMKNKICNDYDQMRVNYLFGLKLL